jgi:hypothetical protein
MTALPTLPGRGPPVNQAAFTPPLGTSTAHLLVRPTCSRKALTLIVGIFKRTGIHGTNFLLVLCPVEKTGETGFI